MAQVSQISVFFYHANHTATHENALYFYKVGPDTTSSK